ncbi:Ankyrin repeats (3 copies) [Legionella steigerwaltii]|uniref:Ankyrin repeats (3 copies) n=2 Tax=Legionella steigerwaltii TaxID=460 RepID=A0A378LED6_9GAMM|nr:Ankyrin repeats (3 copies) [Legionella steigerwaltii]STY22451.1 Ankyrin repeats (3 copies) [Legionella steigerwaltii]
MKLKERLLHAFDEIIASNSSNKSFCDAVQEASKLLQVACNSKTDEIDDAEKASKAINQVIGACRAANVKLSNEFEPLCDELAIWIGWLKYKELPDGKQYDPKLFVVPNGVAIDLKTIPHTELMDAIGQVKSNSEVRTGTKDKSFKARYFNTVIDDINDARKSFGLSPLSQALEEAPIRAFVHLIQYGITDEDFHGYCIKPNIPTTSEVAKSPSISVQKFPHLRMKVQTAPSEEKKQSSVVPKPTRKIEESEPSKATLEKVINGYVDSEHAEQFNSLVQAHLERRKKEGKPLRILLYTWNHPFGIGDFVHNRDLLLYFEKLTGGDPRFQIQSFCILPPEKMKLAKAMIGDHLPVGKTDDVDYFFDESVSDFDVTQADSSRFVIWTGDWSEQRLCPTGFMSREAAAMKYGTLEERNKAKLNEFLKKTDAALMVSRPVGGLIPSNDGFIEKDTRDVLQPLSHTFRQALLELGVGPYQCYSPTNFIHIAKSWGVNTSLETPEAGVKQSTHIRQYKSLALKMGKAKFLQDYNPELLATIVGKNASPAETQAYFEKHHIGFGYLQEEDKFCSFLLANVAQADSKKDIDLFTNFTGEKFDNFFKYLEKHPQVIKFLQNEGVGVIEGPDNREILLLPEGQGRKISVRNFSGMSDDHKDCMIAIANTNAGSGDTSYSEEMDAASIGFPDLPDSLSVPFLQPREWKGGFFKGLLTDMSEGEHLPDLSILREYIKRQLGLVPDEGLTAAQREQSKNQLFREYGRYDGRGPNLSKDDIIITTDVEFAEFIKKNREALMKQWHLYCEHVSKNHDASAEQNNFFMRNIVSSVLLHGTPKEVAELLRVFPDWEHDGINFVLLAADLNHMELLDQLFKENKEQFIKLISRETLLATGPNHPRPWSGIFSLIKHDNLDMLKKILPSIPPDKLQDIFLEAVQHNKKEIIKYLLENTAIDINRKKDSKTLLHVASELGLRDIVQLLLQHGANCTLVDDRHEPPARTAEYFQHHEIVRLINEPIHQAIESGDVHKFEELLAAGMHFDQISILKIIEKGNLTMFHLLLNKYADGFSNGPLTAKIGEQRRGNIFHVMAIHGRHEMITLLADHYKKTNSYKLKLITTPSKASNVHDGGDRLEITAAYLVVENNTPEQAENNAKIIEALHKAGDKFNHYGRYSPLRLAIQKEDIPMIKALRNCGAVYDISWLEQSNKKTEIMAALESIDSAEKRMAHFKDEYKGKDDSQDEDGEHVSISTN